MDTETVKSLTLSLTLIFVHTPQHLFSPQTDNFCTKNHTHVQTYSLSSINEATIPTEKDLIKALLCREYQFEGGSPSAHFLSCAALRALGALPRVLTFHGVYSQAVSQSR